VEPFDHVRRPQCLPLGLGKAEEREELVAALAQARHDAGAALGPCALEGGVRRAGRIGGGRVHDPMKVVADRGESVLRGFALEIAQLVDTGPLHRGPRSHETDGAAEARIAIDDAEHGRAQPACREVVQAALPCRERLAGAEIEGQELLAAVRQDADHADHAEHGHAHDLAGAAHAQGEAVEVEVDRVDVAEGARPPRR